MLCHNRQTAVMLCHNRQTAVTLCHNRQTAVMLCHNRQTAVMLCHNKQTHVLVTFNNMNVDYTAEIKCLAIQITDTLNCHCHVQLLAGKLCCVRWLLW